MEIEFYDKSEIWENLVSEDIYVCGLSVNRLNGNVTYVQIPEKIYIKDIVKYKDINGSNAYPIIKKYNKSGKLSLLNLSNKYKFKYFTTEIECIESFESMCKEARNEFKESLLKIQDKFNDSIEKCKKNFL